MVSQDQSDSHAPDTLERDMDSIIILLDCVVSSTAERMPDTGEAHLPYIKKKHLYLVLERELNSLTVNSR